VPLYEVAFTLVPSIKAQEAGAEETLLVPPTPICAKNEAAAIALVASTNAAAVKPEDGSTLKAHLRPFPST
jgi:hypothetical protein